MEKGSFVFYCDQIEIFQSLPPKSAITLLTRITEYACLGLNTKTDDPLVEGAFLAMKPTLDRDGASYERQCHASRENGKLGGRPHKPK